MNDKVTSDKAGNASSGPACNGSIPIIPLRYAIVPKCETKKDDLSYAGSKGNLEKGFTSLRTSQYTIRTIRPGYIYLYDESKGVVRLWEADGQGNFTALQWASLEDYGKRSNRKETLPHIWAYDCPHTVHIALSSDLWPKSVISKIESDAAFRSKRMQPLKIGEILDGSGNISSQKHVLPVAELEKFVEEYRIPENQQEEVLGWSTFRPDSFTMPSNIRALGAKYGVAHKIKLPVVFALHDPQGIAEDQGNLANQYIHQVRDIKSTLDNKNSVKGSSEVPDCVRLNTQVISELSAEFHRKKTISDIIDNLLKSTYPKDRKLDADIATSKHIIRKGKPNHRGRYGSPIKRHIGESEATLHALTNKRYTGNDTNELMDHINKNELFKFRQEWDSLQRIVEHNKLIALHVTKDHARLLESGEDTFKNRSNTLANCWSCYDRDSKLSAFGLEMAIVLSMDGMGIPVPGKLSQDKRNLLLEKWIESDKSPLHVAAASFNPFKNKLDSVADIVSDTATAAEKAFSLFPKTLATVRITTIITEYSLRKIHGKTRWDRTKSVFKNVMNAIENNNLKKLFKILALRYNIVGDPIDKNPITKKYLSYIDKSLLHAEEVERALKIKGNRSTLVTETTTTTKFSTVPTTDILKSIASAGINNFVAILHALNLKSAIISLSRNASLKNNVALMSALFGMMGAFAEASAATAKLIQKTPIANNLVAGKVIEKMLMRKLTSKAATKFLGYAGAAVEATVHAIEAKNLFDSGDNDAAGYSLAAGLLLGTGIALATKGALAAAVVPGIGWAVAGVLLVAAGIGAIILSIMKKDTPMQIWVSRTIFGIPRLAYGLKKVDQEFKNMSEELENYFVTTYRPILIDEPDKEVFGKSVETDWDQNIGDDQAKFVILLPGYTEGTSKWIRSDITGYDSNDVDSAEDAKKAKVISTNNKATAYQRIKPEGLYLNVKQYFEDTAASASITIDYWPDQAISEQKVTHTFYIDQ